MRNPNESVQCPLYRPALDTLLLISFTLSRTTIPDCSPYPTLPYPTLIPPPTEADHRLYSGHLTFTQLPPRLLVIIIFEPRV